MSFWKGFAEAVKIGDERRFREKMISEEREYAAGVREEDRQFQRQLWLDKLAEERKDQAAAYSREKEFFDYKYGKEQEAANLERQFEVAQSLGLGTTSMSGRTSTKSSSGGGKSKVALLADLSRYPIPEEYIGELSTSESAMQAVLDRLESTRKEFEEAGLVFDPKTQEKIVESIINTNRNIEDVSEEEIEEVFNRYKPFLGGAELQDTVAGTDITWEDLIAGKLAEGEVVPLFDESIVPSTGGEDLGRIIDQMSAEATGYITGQLSAARRAKNDLAEAMKRGEEIPDETKFELDQKIEELTALEEAVKTGDFSGMAESEYMAVILDRMKRRDNFFDPKRVSPDLPHVFIDENSITAALDAGLISMGDTIVFNGQLVKLDPPSPERVPQDPSVPSLDSVGKVGPSGNPRPESMTPDTSEPAEEFEESELDIFPGDLNIDTPPLVSYEEWREMSIEERKKMGLPVSEIGGQWYFRNRNN